MSVGLAIVAVHVIILLAMRFSVVLMRMLKESGILLLTRIAGLLLSAIAAQPIADAVRAFIEEGV